MKVGAYLVADAEPFELVEPGKGPLDNPSSLAQAGAMRGTTSGDLGCDATSPDETAVLVEVVAAVGEQPSGSVPWTAAQATNAGHRVQQGHELSDVVAVSAGQRDGERSSVLIDDEVVLAARPRSVNRRRSGVSPPLRARTCEASIAASSISSSPSLRSSASRTSCRRGHTPASVQSRRRRQAVTPLHPTSSAGTSRQLTLLRST